MDPNILSRMMDGGRMPNFSAVARQGAFRPLATAMPPQSPVAWSNLISGASPGKHQIFDFIHRRVKKPEPGQTKVTGWPIEPFLSTAVTEPDSSWFLRGLNMEKISWGKEWEIPLVSGKTVGQRHGSAFWDLLVGNGIKSHIYRIPANYPVSKASGSGEYRSISGMGTPDLLAGYGTFTKFVENGRKRDPGGGKIRPITVINHKATAYLEGPDNFLRKRVDAEGKTVKDLEMKLRLEIARDPDSDLVKIMIPAEQARHPAGASPVDEPYQQVLLLRKGEWSDWVPIEFHTGVPWERVLSALTLPTRLNGMVRFYIMDVHPALTIYVSPINIDPLRPANSVSEPSDFSMELAKDCGRFYTVGIPEDTSALKSGAITEDEFLMIARLILDEKIVQYRRALERFDSGFLFFYFGSTDQLAHIFWRDRDPDHPGLLEGEMEKYGQVVETCYEEMDGLLGEALKVLNDADTVMVVSDHGFNSFRRGFNVNTWLLANEYLVLKDGVSQKAGLGAIDWTQTRAYALGINSLYVNLKGRESTGIVEDGEERRKLLREIGDKLIEYRDIDGAQVVKTVYVTDDYYPGADREIAPDLLIGYASNYRGSWSTTLGGIPEDIVVDNLERWSGDHCVAADLVPGIIVTNRKLKVDDPSLSDIGPTILDVFGIAKSADMTGRPLLQR